MTSTSISRRHLRAEGFPHVVPIASERVLPADDIAQLNQHLARAEADGAVFLAHVLRHRIDGVRPMPDGLPRDIVTGGCRVRYTIDCGPAQTGLLSHRARADASSGVIPVASLLGATLIGMRTGQRAPLLCPDGATCILTVLAVVHAV